MKFYLLYKNNGLYDPVLDDQEPTYYEPGDLDPESQPTEVPFKIQQFLDPADLGSNLIDYSTINDPLGTHFDPSLLLTEERSLTASPYFNSTKPYRPFSTEPIPEVPPLEEPIILNPDYKDQFVESLLEIDPEFILNSHSENGVVPARFKLPISEQYDPDGTKKVKNPEVDSMLSKYVNMENLSKVSVTSTDKNTTTLIKSSTQSVRNVITDKRVTQLDTNNKSNISKETQECSQINTEDVKVKEEVIKQTESTTRDVKISENTEEFVDRIEESITKVESKKEIVNSHQEIDVSLIEETALSVVDTSIERAVSVAEEIKKEIEEELSYQNEEKTEVSIKESEKKSSIESTEIVEELNVSNIQKEHLVASSEINENRKEVYTEDKLIKSDITAIKQVEQSRENISRKDDISEISSNSTVSNEQYEERTINRPKTSESFKTEYNQSESTGKFKTVTETVTSTTNYDKTDAQQRTYTLGLQTIPNIRGTAHSSYHYDLLLRTFFLHLTDVMVALSRFLLTQPIFNDDSHESQKKSTARDVKQTKQEKVETFTRVDKNEKMATEVSAKDNKIVSAERKQEIKTVKDTNNTGNKVMRGEIVQESKQETKTISQDTNKAEGKKLDRRVLITPTPMQDVQVKARELIQKTEVKETMKTDVKDVKEAHKTEMTSASSVVEEKKSVSGCQMAQRTEKKLTKEMTHKMDALISEFQTIAVEEDNLEMLQRNKRSRSRSRSQIEEEVAKESDPLEWLSKDDSRRASQEICEERLSKSQHTTSSETVEKKHMEKLEKHEIKHRRSKTPKQMYLAVVESHVYTNKDVIFEDASEFSETSSVQSAEETSTALESLEALTTENIAIENALLQLEQAEIKIEESKDFVKVNAESAATMNKSTEEVHQSTNIVQEDVKDVTAMQTRDTKEVVIQESNTVIEPVIEIKQSINKESFSALSIDESSKMESIKVESNKTAVTVIEEDSKKVEHKAQLQIQNKISEKTFKNDAEFAALKIIKEAETEVQSQNEIVEIEEVVDIKSFNQENILMTDTKSSELQESNLITKTSSVVEDFTATQSNMTSKMDVSSTVSKVAKNFKIDSYVTEDLTQESTFTARSVEEKQKTDDVIQESSFTARSIDTKHISEDVTQETSFTAKTVDKKQTMGDVTQQTSLAIRSVDKKLSLRTDLYPQSPSSHPEFIDTPTPATVPPTPLTDEYVFKLSIPLPKSRSTTPIPRDCTPEDEDPQIVKKKLIPHIDTTIEKYTYDPPLPTPPPGGKLQSPVFKTPGLFGGSSKPIYKIRFPPVYRKPGLFGGADRPEYNKEEIREIERKSSLLASAIDETIKSIEEYKEEVGIEKKKEVKFAEFKEEITFQETFTETSVEETTQNGIDVDSSTVVEEVPATNGIVEKEVSNTYVSNALVNGTTTKTEQREETVQITEIAMPEEIISQNIPNGEMTNGFKESELSAVNLVNKEEMKTEIPVERKESPEYTTMERKDQVQTEREDPMSRFRSVVFDPEGAQRPSWTTVTQEPSIPENRQSPYMTESGEIIGTIQGIVDSLEDTVMDAEQAKELGKPGISEEKIAEMMSGESEMLREAHVMGLSRVLKSHMHRADDSSVDFQKIKPMIGSLKDSEVLKALNEELLKKREEEKKKDDKKWTTFLQKPKRAVPKAKFGYYGWTQAEQALVLEPYTVKIVKQSKPKVAPDYKPEDFETGPLPWEERASLASPEPPVEAEEPILIPELPEYLEAVDPLKESEVPDLEDTGIPLPPPKEPTPPPEEPAVQEPEEEPLIEEQPALVEEEVVEQKETRQEMENRLADQLVRSVQGMVDPNASVDQQLSQMRAQLAALAQLPGVIQQTLALVSQQLNQMTQQETIEVSASQTETCTLQEIEESHETTITEEVETTESQEAVQQETETMVIEEVQEQMALEDQVQQEMEKTPEMIEEEVRMEKLKKEQLLQHKMEMEARQLKQRPTPRVGKPTRMFGPPDPDNRPVVLPGGRRWRKTEDVYNEQMIAETLQGQAELIRGKAMGINFMKYEKPPVSLDHLQNSATYKLVHDMDQTPVKRVELLTPVIAEADYRERCRSTTPSGEKKHVQIPQQFHP